MGKKIPKETIAKIPVLFEQYNNKTKVAEELEISISTVNKYLKEYYDGPAERKPRTKITDEMKEQINQLYEQY